MAAGLLLVSGMVLVEPVVAGAVVAPLVGEGVVVEGMVVEEDEEGAGDLTVSSVFLLQPTSARAAARANATAPADLRVGAYISVSF